MSKCNNTQNQSSIGKSLEPISKAEFADKIQQYACLDITHSEADALAKTLIATHQNTYDMDASLLFQDDMIIAHSHPLPNQKIHCIDMEYVLSQQKLYDYQLSTHPPSTNNSSLKKSINHDPNSTIAQLISEHPIFPRWLTERTDFQSHYEELKDVNGIPSNYIIECVLKMNCEERKENDVSILYKWLKLHKILQHVRSSRLVEVCRYVRYSVVVCIYI